MRFKDGQQLTIISISPVFNRTHIREIKLTRTIDRRQAYKVKGKKKEYFLDLTPEIMVFDGWSLPIVISETMQYGYNFLMEDTNGLRKLIGSRHINDLFNKYHLITYASPNEPQSYKFLYQITA